MADKVDEKPLREGDDEQKSSSGDNGAATEEVTKVKEGDEAKSDNAEETETVKE